MNDARKGKRISLNNPKKTYKVEVGVEIGTIINLECSEKDIYKEIEEKVIDVFHIDNQDKILNNIHVYNIQ